MQMTRPDKFKVREVMQRHWQTKQPPLSPEEFRRQLGWGMLQKERGESR